MRRDKPAWQANRGERARKTVAQIEASIEALNVEDLLDLHDIFAPTPNSVLCEFAAKEMSRRGLET